MQNCTKGGDFMMVSTRGRYALRVMIDLAEHSDGKYISMKSVAERQQISLKYMEKILPLLVSANMVEGVQGKGGGYKLTRNPQDYPVGEILRLTEGSISPVACLDCGAERCGRKLDCRTLPMWQQLDGIISQYLDNITLASLMKNDDDK